MHQDAALLSTLLLDWIIISSKINCFLNIGILNKNNKTLSAMYYSNSLSRDTKWLLNPSKITLNARTQLETFTIYHFCKNYVWDVALLSTVFPVVKIISNITDCLLNIGILNKGNKTLSALYYRYFIFIFLLNHSKITSMHSFSCLFILFYCTKI